MPINRLSKYLDAPNHQDPYHRELAEYAIFRLELFLEELGPELVQYARERDRPLKDIFVGIDSVSLVFEEVPSPMTNARNRRKEK